MLVYGCLITCNCSDDLSIKPEDLNDYILPPPSIVHPTLEKPKGNYDDIQTIELDPDPLDDGPNEIIADNNYLVPDEDDDERNTGQMIELCSEYLSVRCICLYAFDYRVWIHSETRTWHDKNIQSNAPYRSTQNRAQLFGQFGQMV